MIKLIVLLLALVAAYWFFARPMLRRLAVLRPVFDELDAVEAGAWAKFCLWFNGMKTVLVSRLFWVPGSIVALYDQLAKAMGDAGVDWKSWVPQERVWLIPFVVVGVGFLFEYLRKISNGVVAPAALASDAHSLDERA